MVASVALLGSKFVRRAGVPIELDAVALDANDSQTALVVECKLQIRPAAVPSTLEALAVKALACPALAGKEIEVALWTLRRPGRARHAQWLTAKDLVGVVPAASGR